MNAFWLAGVLPSLQQEVYCLVWYPRRTRDIWSGSADTQPLAPGGAGEEAGTCWQEVLPFPFGGKPSFDWRRYSRSKDFIGFLLSRPHLSTGSWFMQVEWVIKRCWGLILVCRWMRRSRRYWVTGCGGGQSLKYWNTQYNISLCWLALKACG